MSVGHLKDYPIPVPRKPMPLNGFNKLKPETIKQFQTARILASPRSRSRSDLSDSTRSNYSSDDLVQVPDSEDGLSVLTSNTSCPPSPMKSASQPGSFSNPQPQPNPQSETQPQSDTQTQVQTEATKTSLEFSSSVSSINSIISTPQDDYLNLIEPNPIFPPEYNSLPPGGCPRFPVVSDSLVREEGLPGYTPSIYKLGVLTRKVEWLNPYEPSSSRSWKNYVVELNSTQLNLYAIPSNVESHLMSFQIDHCPNAHTDKYRNYATNFKVGETEDFSRLKSDLTNRYDYEFYKFCERLRVPKKLVRTYSLQHCKIGLASDYKKRSNVLRLRIESEQILLAFQSTKDLIDWNLALNIGKDLSLDLSDRELPRYRTVPRRRRRRADGGIDPLYLDFGPSEGRNRSNSEPTNLMHKMSKLKLKLRRDSSSTTLNGLNSGSLNVDFLSNSNSASVTSMISIVEPSSIEPSCVEDEDDISEYNSDEDEDDEDESDPEMSRLRKQTRTRPRSRTNEKWNPNIESQTLRKYYKNCIRCIKPLNFDDSWVSKHLVKPTSFTLLNLSLSHSHSNINLQSVQNFKKNDNNLGRVPDHFVKEFVVGTHGLIPKQQTSN